MNKPPMPFTLWQSFVMLICGVLLVIGVELIVNYEQQRLQAQLQQQHLTIADKLRANLETELNIPLYLTVGLASYIAAKEGNIDDNELNILLPGLVRQAQYVRNIGIAPGNRLSYIFPLSGNEQALNLYYPDIPEQWPAIAEIITQREAKLSGPIQLRQGGTAFIYRYPIFMSDHSYWGILSTVLDIEPIWQQLSAQTANLDVQIALRNRLDHGDFSETFFGSAHLFTAPNLLVNVVIRGANWQMAIAATNQPFARTALFRFLLYLPGLMLLLLLSRLFITLQRLKHSSDALRDNQQMLISVHDNVIDAILTLDNKGVILTANKGCYDIYGYPIASLPGKPWQILLAKHEDAEHIYQQSASKHAEVECQGQRANGEVLDLLLLHTKLPLEHQHRHLLVLRDITERKRVERLQNDFVATVSHELRTPLTAIKGTLGLAVGGALGTLTEKQSKMLLLAQQSCQQLHQLVNDLLDFEKLSSGNMPFTFLAINPVQLLEDCIAQLNVAHVRRIKLQSRLGETAKVLADETRLRQVCINLLSNALKFSAANSVIYIDIEMQGAMLKVSFIDQGKGVPLSFEPLLFSRFSQANSASVREQGGTGLGLAICKEIIEKMQGEIAYHRLPEGSCFYFTLPLATPQQS